LTEIATADPGIITQARAAFNNTLKDPDMLADATSFSRSRARKSPRCWTPCMRHRRP
jgi:hypothetical protein